MKLTSNYNDSDALIVQDAARYNQQILRESLEMFRQEQFCAAECTDSTRSGLVTTPLNESLHLADDSQKHHQQSRPTFIVRPHQKKKNSVDEETGISRIIEKKPSKFQSIINKIRKFLHFN